jgi:hypothetical protein
MALIYGFLSLVFYGLLSLRSWPQVPAWIGPAFGALGLSFYALAYWIPRRRGRLGRLLAEASALWAIWLLGALLFRWGYSGFGMLLGGGGGLLYFLRLARLAH